MAQVLTRLALCLEELEPDPGRFTQCVALQEEEPGLGLDGTGEIQWMTDPGPGCRLYVDGDQLMVGRTEGQTAVVERGGRTLDLSPETPVAVLNGDEITVGQRRMRVHLHGEALTSHPPTPVANPPLDPGLPAELQVRDHPPKAAGGVIPGTGALGNLILLLLVLAAVVGLVVYLFVY